MYILIAFVFIVGYLFIALEHSIKIDKAATAILTGVLCWVLIILGKDVIFPNTVDIHTIDQEILHHIGEIAEILFFLLGAMTIVELVDAHNGFEVITSKIKTVNRVKLLWIICLTTFFFSSVLDNLTTAIVMATLLRKIISDKEDLWFFAGMVVIAANAGGAWSPIGDVTTIMLWIGGQVTAVNIMAKVFLPSIICLIVPLTIASFMGKKTINRKEVIEDSKESQKISQKESNLVLGVGVLGLLFVPVFKNITHLPPFMGMLFSLGIIWVFTEILHRKKSDSYKNKLAVSTIIRKVDTPSVLFFLGILLAVAGLQTAGHLEQLAVTLNETFNNIYMTNIFIGFLSSIVDNVPLVAGAMGMYSLDVFPQDHVFWEMLAYCAGTGGSALIIGSAAGVAIMGILKIDFIWYLKRISFLAIIGYLSGVATYYLLNI
ncbi:sodium:proton antiporter NhaD [uncultured Polaribacter sp.]|uniref:sodium:proton antiporter NhaD n=1 Tax=uncultured Polaribacter sp. TaxID=174711 RepID=UPI0030DCE346|tara:strand:- start:8023 stop:9318 length:1296 start_codon:yes stop_codon:yes gene_type:complete